ncbi:tetratricopeptide repeat protein [Polynucleobacter sp. UB-Piko-W3]|uniref:O-linked N-acetylglucosamine transferase, SPINDLY family protein n=1 Tax=Polynucleobacter sp. UB-Piko-W3 TaxID=1819735 RepID=UPI001C0DEF00|nr:tetratricopeptide repeat protein [Polynucleobacter sp. UB-Piko-W3]
MTPAYAPLIQQMMLEFQNQRLESAERIARSILRVNSKDILALQVQGLCLAMQGRAEESIEPFAKAAKLDSKNSELLTNLAKAQHQAEFYGDAVQTFEKLNRLTPNKPQVLTDMGTSYAKLRQYDQSKAAYEKAISLDPNYFLAWSNRGNLQAEQGYPLEAIASYERALQLNPSYAEAWTNYGNAFFDLGRFDDACKAHDQALSCNVHYAEAWFNKGNSLNELKQGESALEHYSRAYELKPDIPFLMGQLMNSLAINCSWDSNDRLITEVLRAVAENKPACPPFMLLQTPADLALQRKSAEIYIREHTPYENLSNFQSLEKKKHASRRIRIGYFSSDLKDHPVGILMENLLRLHDRSRFEIFGYFLSKKSNDELENSLVSSFDHSLDLFGKHDDEVCKLVSEHDLDIAIDLNGHTAGARTGLFARRMAALQVNYLGYAGTTGANFYDYLIADQVAIPSHYHSHFSEKIAYMPHSFFPADTLIARENFGSIPARKSQGLPEEGFIFASFNNAYKITQNIFSTWMKLLQNVENSVLWLSMPSQSAMKNLLASAQKYHIDSTRIIFAKRESARVDHLSRLRLANLFLDTPYFNAHTTAADALWAGVPVLTQIGETFAGRVAASQLSALGMPELIVNTDDEYYAKAMELASNAQLLSALRNKQEANRLTTPLFNTRQYVKDLESLYASFLE